MARIETARDSFAVRLLAWYDRHRRRLPWRAEPGEPPEPYRVWLSEVMLQQTTVQTVAPRFLRFLERWPTVDALAAAPLDDVLAEWAGLGYYARARNLHACARAVVERHGGEFPSDVRALRELPGIGDYTAGAIAAIAFDRPYAAVDGNVERVIARHRAIDQPMPAAKERIRTVAQALVPAERAGDFAQAFMDLGATICAPAKANCLLCPVAEDCLARAAGDPGRYPVKAEKGEKPRWYGHAFWVEDGAGRVLLRRRPDRGLLGGMLEVPGGPWLEKHDVSEAYAPPVEARWQQVPQAVEHTFTHFHLTLAVHRAEGPAAGEPRGEGDWRWVPVDGLADAALPTVMRKVVARAIGAGRVRPKKR
ncbi:MAG: A/G-specific adenine glycosylase [Hyphomicrobiales bacterium]